MSRKVLVLVLLGVIGGCVVALVRAQDSSRRTNAYSGTSSGASLKSVLAHSSPSAEADAETGSSSRRPSSLADRLKSIRENVTDEYNAEADAPTADSVIVPGDPGLIRLEPKSAEPIDPPAARPSVRSAAVPTSKPAVRNSSDFQPVPARELSGDHLLGPPPSSALTEHDTDDETHATGSSLRHQDSVHAWTGAEQESSRRTARLPEGHGDIVPAMPTVRDINLSSHIPSIRVDTIGPRAIVIGKQAAYQITVTNAGDADASDISVTVDVPSWIDVIGSEATVGTPRLDRETRDAKQMVWAIDSLPAQAQHQMKLYVVPRQSEPFQLSVNWQCTPDSSVARIDVQVPQLEMSIAGPEDILHGATGKYIITLSNPGTGDAQDVTVNLSPYIGGGAKVVGTVPAGGHKDIVAEFTAREAGRIQIHCDATADGGMKADASHTVLIRRASLAITASGPSFKYAGNQATYEIRVANSGNAVAEDVIAAVALPTGAKYLGGVEGAQMLEGGLRWRIGRLEAGAHQDYAVRCELNLPGENRLDAGVQARGDLAASHAAVTTVESLADLKLTVNDPKGPQPVGQEVVYEVHIHNRGTKAARRVKVIAQFSEGIEPVAATGASAEIVPGQVLYEAISAVEAGEHVTLKITARADRPGNHIFRTEVKCEEPESRLIAEETTRYFGDSVSRTSEPSATLDAPRSSSRRPAPALPVDVRR